MLSPCRHRHGDIEFGFSTWTNRKLSSVTSGSFVVVWGEGRREGGGITAAERRLQEVCRFWSLPLYFCLPAARSGSSKHGPTGRCHLALRRCKKQFLLWFGFQLHNLCGYKEVECSLFVLFCFNAEFKENGNNNNTPAIPVSMPSVAPACCEVTFRRLPPPAFVLQHTFLWGQELGGKVGLVENALLLEKMVATAEEAGVWVRSRAGTAFCEPLCVHLGAPQKERL